MKTALLIGNGFTSNLIGEYKDQSMMEALCNKVPDLVSNVEHEFDKIRNIKITDRELVTVTAALFPSDNLYPSNDLFPSDDSIQITTEVKNSIIKRLSELKFTNPEMIFKSYFKNNGLIFLVNKEKVIGIENYLKVIKLFKEIGIFSEDDYNNIKNVANNLYFNNGSHGKASISNLEVDLIKLESHLNTYEDIYTTNYDTILDDFLEHNGKIPYHLHGGYSINHRNKDPDGRYGPDNAILVWGINSQEKFEYLSDGMDFSDIDFSVFRFGQSRLADYFDYLRDNEYDEIHILGYSGENDYHINQRIKDNQHIISIIVYVDPLKINDTKTEVRNRIIFGCPGKQVIFRPWDDFWNSCCI